MSSNITPCRCSMAAEALILENATTVPAGSVSNGLSVCGYETELNRLPNISFVPMPLSPSERFIPNL